MYFDHIHPPPTPPPSFRIPISQLYILLIFLNNPPSPICVDYKLMGIWLSTRGTPLKTIGSPSPRSSHLSIISQFGMNRAPPTSGWNTERLVLVQVSCRQLTCSELMSAAVLSGREESVLFCFFSTSESYHLSTTSPTNSLVPGVRNMM